MDDGKTPKQCATHDEVLENRRHLACEPFEMSAQMPFREMYGNQRPLTDDEVEEPVLKEVGRQGSAKRASDHRQ